MTYMYSYVYLYIPNMWQPKWQHPIHSNTRTSFGTQIPMSPKMQPILEHVRHEMRNPEVQNVSCFNVQKRTAFDTNIEHGPSSTPEKISGPLRIQCGRGTAIALIMHQRIHHNSEMFLQGHLLNIVEICWTFVQVCPVSTIVYHILPKEKIIKVDYQTKL